MGDHFVPLSIRVLGHHDINNWHLPRANSSSTTMK